MTYYPMDEYKLLGFEPSRRKNKKYDAIIVNRQTKKTIRVPFGDVFFEQYKDNTGSGLYSHKDHLDEQRRMKYITRHRRWVLDDFYSPSYFSMKYLW
jgi:hypothetical protein